MHTGLASWFPMNLTLLFCLLSSPHVQTIRERITLGISGEPVSAKTLSNHFQSIQTIIDHAVQLENHLLSHFEVWAKQGICLVAQVKDGFTYLSIGSIWSYFFCFSSNFNSVCYLLSYQMFFSLEFVCAITVALYYISQVFTAVAFSLFAREGIDIAVIEVGYLLVTPWLLIGAFLFCSLIQW